MEEIIGLGALIWLGLSLARLIQYKKLKKRIKGPLINLCLSFLLLLAAVWLIIAVSKSGG